MCMEGVEGGASEERGYRQHFICGTVPRAEPQKTTPTGMPTMSLRHDFPF